jgi:hypothetical protein
MPWHWGWPPYVPECVRADKERASADLDQSSEDLTVTIQSAKRVHRIADSLDVIQKRNHFSEAMESLFTRPPHPKDTP